MTSSDTDNNVNMSTSLGKTVEINKCDVETSGRGDPVISILPVVNSDTICRRETEEIVHRESRRQNMEDSSGPLRIDIRHTLEGAPSTKAVGSQTQDEIKAAHTRKDAPEINTERPKEDELVKEADDKLHQPLTGSDKQDIKCQQVLLAGDTLGATPSIQKGQGVLQEMKRRLSQTAMAHAHSQVREGRKDHKASCVPGTNCEYRTPGANYKNKNGRVKRPMNAFMVWAREFRGRLAAAMPNATNSDISVTLGQVWAALSSEDKKQYYEAAERIKQKHRQDFPDWVYQPSAQRKEDPPAQRTISHTTQVVVNTDPSSSPAALNRGPSQMMPEKRKTEITSPVTSTSILTSKTEETRSTQSMTSVLTSTPGNIMHLPHLSLSDASTVSAGSIRAATHEAFEQKRIPVYLQRVTYRPMTRCPLRNSHVSPITKDMLANKIANGRATTDETRQQTNVMLAPPVHRPTVPPSFVPLSVPCHPFRMRTPVIDTLQHVHQTEGRSIDLIDQSRALNRAATLKPVPDFKSYISPVARLPNVSECMSSASNKASPSSLLFGATRSKSRDSTTQRMSSDDNSSSTELIKNTVADDTWKLKDAGEQEVADICKIQDKDNDKILHDLKSSISEIFKRSQCVSLDHVTTSSCPQQTTGSATMLLPSEPDDLWPFPFSQNPEEWDFDDCSLEGLYMELRDPYDPFLFGDNLLSDTFPGSLPLDIDKWKRYLDEDNDASDPLTTFTADQDVDIQITPLPLKETLRRMLKADVQTSENCDVITGECDVLDDETSNYDDAVPPVQLTAEEAVEITTALANIFTKTENADCQSTKSNSVTSSPVSLNRESSETKTVIYCEKSDIPVSMGSKNDVKTTQTTESETVSMESILQGQMIESTPKIERSRNAELVQDEHKETETKDEEKKAYGHRITKSLQNNLTKPPPKRGRPRISRKKQNV